MNEKFSQFGQFFVAPTYPVLAIQDLEQALSDAFNQIIETEEVIAPPAPQLAPPLITDEGVLMPLPPLPPLPEKLPALPPLPLPSVPAVLTEKKGFQIPSWLLLAVGAYLIIQSDRSDRSEQPKR